MPGLETDKSCPLSGSEAAMARDKVKHFNCGERQKRKKAEV
jgi:hypothetical protein